jgi:hypothetical protein
MDFDDVESVQEDQELVLSSDELAGAEIILDFVKYQNVTNLTIFVDENLEGSDFTEILSLDLHGCPVMKTDMSAFKKVG